MDESGAPALGQRGGTTSGHQILQLLGGPQFGSKSKKDHEKSTYPISEQRGIVSEGNEAGASKKVAFNVSSTLDDEETRNIKLKLRGMHTKFVYIKYQFFQQIVLHFVNVQRQ